MMSNYYQAMGAEEDGFFSFVKTAFEKAKAEEAAKKSRTMWYIGGGAAVLTALLFWKR